MTIAEFSEKKGLDRHKLILQAVRIERGKETDEFFFKDGSSQIFPRKIRK